MITLIATHKKHSKSDFGHKPGPDLFLCHLILNFVIETAGDGTEITNLTQNRHMTTQDYPIGIQTFRTIREEGKLYVDKTAYIHQLVSKGKYYFLSRPRRFGKSLLISTLKSFFEGHKELFEGLDICRHPHDWLAYPIFHFNLVNFDASRTDGLHSILNAHFANWEKEYGKDESEIDYSQRLYGLIKRATEKTGRKVVILIDEYDKALTATMTNPSLNSEMRNILYPIYSCLKGADEFIRFAMLTGVTRFSHLSIFSGINNLFDISLSPHFGAICGITQEELCRYFLPGIKNLARYRNISSEEAIRKLKSTYDGYHFSENCPDIYNPYSLMCALESLRFGSFWYTTGTPEFLLKSLRESSLYLPDLLHSEATEQQLAEVESYTRTPVSLLFQTGYLTIKSWNADSSIISLGFPNKEVEEAFFDGLLPAYSDTENFVASDSINHFIKSVNAGDPATFIESLQSFLADIPYNLSRCKPEIYFENNLYIIFRLLGYRISTEYKTSRGRIDIVLRTEDFIYVMELKLNKSAQEAIDRINSKEYAMPFRREGCKLFKIGMNFSSQSRTIDSWIIETD